MTAVAGRHAATPPGGEAASPPGPLAFVISSGRCGSTALSAVLRMHPRVLSLSEFFRALGPAALRPGQCTAAGFWDVLAQPRPHMTALLRYRVEPSEVTYPVDSGRRFSRAGGVPPIMAMALPHLTDEPDALLDELHDEIAGWPERPLPDHFRALFAWLRARFGREMVVERSGGSLAMAEGILRFFPEARFIHLYRDGRRVAVSMSRHIAFRLWLAAQDVARSVHPDATLDEVAGVALAQGAPDPVRLAAMTVDRRADALLRAMGFPADQVRSPVWRFGALWTAMEYHGAATLRRLARDRILEVDFDDLLARPAATLDLIDRFLAPAQAPGGGEWIARSTAVLRPGAANWDEALSPMERRRLDIACRPGMKLLYGAGQASTA